MKQYIVTGMSCAACQARVEKAVSKVPGVTSCSVSLLTNSMGVEGDVPSDRIIRAVEAAGYGASVKGGAEKQEKTSDFSEEEEALKDRETPKLKKRLILSVGFLIVLMYISMGHNMLGLPLPSYFNDNYTGLALAQMILAAIVLVINQKFFTSGFSSLFHLSPNMDSLVALGSSVAFCWSTYVFFKLCGMAAEGAANAELMGVYHNQLYYEASAMIPALITVGKMLEAMSKGRTTNALKSLMKLAPKTALIVEDGQEKEVSIEQVSEGDIFAVRPGSSIPVDGIVIEGVSAVDESALTGESIPVDKAEGDKVSAATINSSGYLLCRATRVGKDTTLSQIIQMVSDAAATKAPIARIADKVSGVFVPAVIGIAIIVIICWLIAGQSVSFALARAISVLVISCPCALGLATPVAIMVGNGMGAKNGILFKNGAALENAGRIEIIALDKTGTITEGSPKVIEIIPAEGVDRKELLLKAYAIESKSEHPLAKAVTEACDAREGGMVTITGFKALPGNGLEALAGGVPVHAGSGKFIRSFAAVDEELSEKERELSEKGQTPLFFEEDGRLLGMITVADVIKKDSPEAVRELKSMGIEVVMLTGDNERTAKAVGDLAGVDEIIAGVLPEGKEAVIRSLQQRGKCAMVGDGINDAPALTRADTGIAIGAGTDVAIDSADIVVMNSSLIDVVAAIRLSRATLRNIHQNLFWAFIYNIICIPLAAGVFVWEMNPMIGAAAMSLSSFTVCMNALRLNLFRLYDTAHDRPRRRSTGGNKKILDNDVFSDNGKVCTDRINMISPVGEENGTNGNIAERNNNMEKTVKIEGMMCPHCEATVKKALEALDNVASAEPSHEKNNAVLTLSGEVSDELIRQTVEAAGYTFTGIE